jgi:3alpha(or 20beta)-hydroxysteroid dehydrogenase
MSRARVLLGAEDSRPAATVSIGGGDPAAAPTATTVTAGPRLRRGGAAPRNPSLAAVTAHCPVAYTTSKWALRGLSQVASMELVPSNIRVNSIHPGFIETPMTASASPAFLAASLSQTPLSRAGQPEEVAALVTFLLSAAAAFITVAEIPVDGGQPGHGGAKAISDALRVTT